MVEGVGVGPFFEMKVIKIITKHFIRSKKQGTINIFKFSEMVIFQGKSNACFLNVCCSQVATILKIRVDALQNYITVCLPWLLCMILPRGKGLVTNAFQKLRMVANANRIRRHSQTFALHSTYKHIARYIEHLYSNPVPWKRWYHIS